MPDIILPGPAGRIEARYQRQKAPGAPMALVLHPHPQFGGTMNNKIVYDLFYAFVQRGFSALRCHHMFRIYNCIAYAHDLRLVGLAALVCVLASFAAVNLLRHARKSHGQMRGLWLAVSAISTGFGIWATHFIAMLAFTPGIPSGYNIALTILSPVAAIVPPHDCRAPGCETLWAFGGYGRLEDIPGAR